MTKRSEIIEGSVAATSTYGVVYSCKCGWIDIGHGTARSKRPFIGADKLWAQVNGETGKKSPNGLWHQVIYRQDMMKNLIVTTIADDVTREYAVQVGLTLAQKEAVALSIFIEVSLSFEELQGKGIYAFSNSSFSGEDLVSNLIGFYRVVRPTIDYLTLCGPVSKAASEAVWDKHGAPGAAANKNRSFTPKLYPCTACKDGPSTPTNMMLPAVLTLITPLPIGALYRNWNPAEPDQKDAPPKDEPKPPPGPDTTKPKVAEPKTITVQRGDTLSGLAASEYKNWRYWPLLWDANRGAVGTNPNRLKRGTVLRLPTFDSFTTQQKADAVRLSPQWKIFPP